MLEGLAGKVQTYTIQIVVAVVVITILFLGNFPSYFNDRNRLIYINISDKYEDLLDVTEEIKDRDNRIKTTKKILPYH